MPPNRRREQPIAPPAPTPVEPKFVEPILSDADLASIEAQKAIDAARIDVGIEVEVLKQVLLTGGVISPEGLAEARNVVEDATS